VGRITSAVGDPGTGTVVALGFVPRALRVPGERLAVGEDGPPRAVVVEPEVAS
jgi:glycine cleavage system aminomethyltransferase T